MYKAAYTYTTLFIIAMSMAPVVTRAQDVNEAYNLSNLIPQGTARSMGFGGALGSVGGDFSAISVNPAGLGVYRSSELSFSPSLKINSSSSSYVGSTDNATNARVGISNFGIVFTDAPGGKRYERRKWKAISFAMGMNRIADFNHDYTYNGNNSTSSASQAFEASANRDSTNISDASTFAAIGDAANLLTYSSGAFTTRVPFSGGIRQLNIVKERGAINEYVLSLGGNYKEKLMVGVTLGIPSFKYSRTSDYSETILASNHANNPYNFETFVYNNTLNITGTGVNLKLGAIYKCADWFRVGAAIHTPTLYSIDDVTDYGISSLVGGLAYSASTANNFPVLQFNYKFITPVRSLLSATFILKKFGFITADYEYVSYSTMRFIYPDGMDGPVSYSYEAKQINDAIQNIYKGASNLRLGAEIKITKYFMVRGGVGYYGNPYRNPAVSSERLDVSAGLGYRTTNFFADFAFVNSHYKFAEQPYSNIDYSYVSSGAPAVIPMATITQALNNATFTVGVKF